MLESYTPSEKILAKYAELIVQFGMQNRHGKRLKKGSVVQFIVPEVAKPLYVHLQRAILKNGYHPLGTFVPDSDDKYNLEEDFFNLASKEQRRFFAEQHTKGTIDQIDGVIYISASTNPHALKNIDPKLILERAEALKEGKKYRWKKIDADKLQWTIALYGTEAMAKEVGLSLKEYWEQIVKACYLDKADPVNEWKKINQTVSETAKKLSKMKIHSLHVVGKDMDISFEFVDDLKWLAGGGCNIPSFEVFTVPKWQTVNGWIKFNQPHYRHEYGKAIDGVELWFKNGVVNKSKATKNHDLLKSMLKTPGGNKLGEFSLTDSRVSRISKFMAEILYDENIGGPFGNTHMALGASFRECYTGKVNSKWKASDWQKLGFNNSVVHSDLISTTDRTVTAILKNGDEKVIYQDGRFTL